MKKTIALGLLLFLGTAGTTTAQFTVLISSDPGALPGNADSRLADCSFDGRWVAFESSATNLDPGATSGLPQIFVKDLWTWDVELVSVSTLGVTANSLCSNPRISPDGRFVVFESHATNLVSGDTNGAGDVFLRDRVTGTTTRESLGPGGAQLALGGVQPDLSADARFVLFYTNSTDVVPGNTSGQPQHYLRDRASNLSLSTAVSTGGTLANNASDWVADLSADGHYVVFASFASNLVPADTNGTEDVFLRDVWAGTTSRISVAAAGGNANGTSRLPRISADGTTVVYETGATNIVVPDTNSRTDVIVHQLDTGFVERVSVNTLGAEGNGDSENPSVSFDGRYVAYRSFAGNLVAGDANGTWDVFVRDRISNSTELASWTTAGGQAGGGGVYLADISPNGRFVSMWTTEALDPSHPASTWQVYVRERGLVCISAITYCTGKTNSLGCVPWMATYGCSSATQDSGFYVFGGNVRNNKQGLLFYGVSGQSATPFQGGTMCVAAPKKRTPIRDSGGNPLPANDCTGLWVIDMNAFAAGQGGGNPLPALLATGTIVDCQWWGRDPGAPFQTALSNALEYLVGL